MKIVPSLPEIKSLPNLTLRHFDRNCTNGIIGQTLVTWAANSATCKGSAVLAHHWLLVTFEVSFLLLRIVFLTNYYCSPPLLLLSMCSAIEAWQEQKMIIFLFAHYAIILLHPQRPASELFEIYI